MVSYNYFVTCDKCFIFEAKKIFLVEIILLFAITCFMVMNIRGRQRQRERKRERWRKEEEDRRKLILREMEKRVKEREKKYRDMMAKLWVKER
jgi:hypothetical protein